MLLESVENALECVENVLERSEMDECKNCGFLNEFGYCECSPSDKWYACPIESEKPENIQALREYAERGEEDGCCSKHIARHCDTHMHISFTASRQGNYKNRAR